MQPPQCLVFGPFRLDLRDERLWCGPEAIPLSPKTFAVLRLPGDAGGPACDQRRLAGGSLARNNGE